MEILPGQEEEDSTSSTTLLDKLTEPKNGDSEEEDNGEQPDRALEREEPTRESSSYTGSQSMSNNGQKGPSELRKGSQAKLTTPPDSVTKNMLENYSTHHSNATIIPAKPSSTQSTLSDQPRHSGRERKAPIHDDDSQYLVLSYKNQRLHLPIGNPRERMRATNKDDGCGRNTTNVTALTEESAEAAVLKDPISYHDVLSWDDREKWEEACRSELETFKRMEVFEEVKKPNDHKIIGCKWVFRYKLGPDGQIRKYKVRLVVQGFSQIKGIDYNETFLPVTKFNLIRLLLALSACFDWEIHQMNVKSAFLNRALNEKI